MTQHEIDTIKQIAIIFNAELTEDSRNVPISNVKEYSFSLNQQIQASYIERRSHTIAANNSYKRTIFKMAIPKADLRIEKDSFWNRLFKSDWENTHKVISQDEKLRDKIHVNKEINDFLKADKHSFTMRTNEQGSQSILELKYTAFILDMDYLMDAEQFMSRIGTIINQ